MKQRIKEPRKHPPIIYFRILSVVVVAWAVLGLGGGTVIAGENATKVKPLPLEKMRVVAYSKDFAKRFGLPLPQPAFETSGGLEAIEFSIEKRRPWTPIVSSNYRLYVDSSLAIEYPESKDCGDVAVLIKNSHFFGQTQEQFLKWKQKDRYYFNEKNTKYARKAILATMNHEDGKHGASYGLWYESYRKEIFYGLDYIHLYGLGHPFKTYHREGIGVWLKKIGKVDYRENTIVDEKEFIKFQLPRAFYEKVMELEKMAKEYNDSIKTRN